MRVFWTIITLCFLGLLTSCNLLKPESHTHPGINPFTHSGSERNMIVIISDLHLGADLSYSETVTNLKPLEHLLNKIRISPNVKELVIAGDLADEWFVPATTDTYDGQGQIGFVQRVAQTNPGVINAINAIIQDGEILVTYIPGNHDLGISAENYANILPGISQARDEEQGLGTYSPEGHPEIAIEHGHRYNMFCAPDPLSNQTVSPGSIQPPGYFFTRIAALHVAQNCHTSGDTLPTITPNTSGGNSQLAAYYYWETWKGLLTNLPIQNSFDEKIIVTNIDGVHGTYSVNDILPYQSTPGGVIDFTLFHGIYENWEQRQILNHVPIHIPAELAMLNATSNPFTDTQAATQYFMNPASNKRIVVFGHTHVSAFITSNNYNGLKSIYANSGTWIDHNPGQPLMTFVVITPQNTDTASQTYVKLYNYEGEVVTQMATDSLRY